jgi:GxxExxY protein
MGLNAISGGVVGGAIKVHKYLGPGLLESVYEECLAEELRNRGFLVRTQVAVPITYGRVRLDVGYRIDMVVNDAMIVELKAVDRLRAVHMAQLLSHLRLSNYRVGLLINFNVACLVDGIRRMVNNHNE